MRRSLALLLLAAATVSSLAFTAAAPEAPMVCVRYRDTEVPGTPITIREPLPGDRFCVEIVMPGADA